MFRMIKLAAFVLFGYFIYEAIKGIAEPRQSSRSSGQPSNSGGQEQSRMPGGGNQEDMASIPVFDASGGRRTQRVGRGVIAR